MIIFVGDKPSSKNKNPDIPFVGTQSYKRLLEWIWKMDLDVTEVMLCNKDNIHEYSFGGVFTIRTNHQHLDLAPEDKVIALGKEAVRFLKESGIDYFELPHPSGLNRKVNNKQWLGRELKKCQKWIKTDLKN